MKILHARLEYHGDHSQITPWILDIIFVDGTRETFGFYCGSWGKHHEYLWRLLSR